MILSRFRHVTKTAPKVGEIQNEPETPAILGDFVGETGQDVVPISDPRSTFRRGGELLPDRAPLYFPPIAASPSDASEMPSTPPLIQGCGNRSCSQRCEEVSDNMRFKFVCIS
jgi:hypothetical protein